VVFALICPYTLWYYGGIARGADRLGDERFEPTQEI
jgi:hypothetical protein